jgi:hypothetical protein
MATKINIGPMAALNRMGVRSNDWARQGNTNWIKMAAMFNPSVVSKTSALPESAPEGTLYIDPADKQVCMWVDAFDDGTPGTAGWYAMGPNVGAFVYVEDQNAMYAWDKNVSDWKLLVDFDAPHQYVRREFSFYVPGLVRPSATIFSYVAGMEFTLEAGAPDSGANCEIAPTSAVTFNIVKSGATIGTIAFAAGSTSGVISVPSEIVINPALPGENQYVYANVLRIYSPGNVYGMNGLNVTLRGKIRAID